MPRKKRSDTEVNVLEVKSDAVAEDTKEKIKSLEAQIKELKEKEAKAGSAGSEGIKTKSKNSGAVWFLVVLVILLLIVDAVSIYAFYKPHFDFSFLNGNAVQADSLKCSDGTAYGQCSNDKPFYCYQGELMKNANHCGCPSGYTMSFQDCKKI